MRHVACFGAVGMQGEADPERRYDGRRAVRAEIVWRLAEAAMGVAELDDQLDEVNRVLGRRTAVRLRSLAVLDADAGDVLGVDPPQGVEAEAVREWRHRLSAGALAVTPVTVPGGLLVAAVHRRKVEGLLRFDVPELPVTSDDEELLGAVGEGFGEVLSKTAMVSARMTTERVHAVAAERERIARDLHGTVGRLFLAIGARAAEYAEEAPDNLWRGRLDELLRLAGEGNRVVRAVISSLAFSEVGARGLPAALHALAEKFEVTTGIATWDQIPLDPLSLTPEEENALYRVAAEALSNVERHAEAERVTVGLWRDGGEVVLVVEDDGEGLRAPGVDEEAHDGLRGTEALVRSVGGRMTVREASPHGVRVEARVPVRPLDERRTEGDATGARRPG